jgi:transaldolase
MRPTMAQKIDVRPLGPHEYAVTLTEGTDTTNHRVTVPEELLDELALDPQDKETEENLVRESMAYLLDRVNADEIEHDVDLEEIANEHEDYSGELSSRLGL